MELKSNGKAVHIARSQCSAGQGTRAVAEDPPTITEYPIARARSPEPGYIRWLLPDACPFPLLAMAWPKAPIGSGAGGAAECHFPDNAGKAYR